MKAPPNDAAVPEQPQNNQADNLASSYNNDNMSEYFDAQSDFNTTVCLFPSINLLQIPVIASTLG